MYVPFIIPPFCWEQGDWGNIIANPPNVFFLGIPFIMRVTGVINSRIWVVAKLYLNIIERNPKAHSERYENLNEWQLRLSSLGHYKSTTTPSLNPSPQSSQSLPNWSTLTFAFRSEVSQIGASVELLRVLPVQPVTNNEHQVGDLVK